MCRKFNAPVKYLRIFFFALDNFSTKSIIFPGRPIQGMGAFADLE